MSENKSLLVLSNQGAEDGWRLGGSTAVTVSNADELNRELESALGNESIGIVALPENLRGMASKNILSAFEKAPFPILFFYPTG
ncbi:MAG: hypothetical protein HY280_09865 [Nitrospinae bacterium]|nr:hypothetical protein [Nitrospinota bacterium]